jgi:glycosyltransferase involved in cell wall biosynthesis
MKKPIRVLYTSHYSTLKMGGQRSMVSLIENLDRSVVTPMAVLPERGELSETLEKLRCPVTFMPFTKITFKYWKAIYRTIQDLRAFITENDIDIVHADEEREIFFSGLAKRKTNAKMVWHVKIIRPHHLDKISVHFADGFIGCSNGTKVRFPEKYLPKYRVIYDGYNDKIFFPVVEKHTLRKKLGLPENRVVIAFIGQLKRGKGIFDLLHAIALIKKELPQTEMPYFALLGVPVSDAIKAELDTAYASLGLTPTDAAFLGQKQSIHEWMQAPDAVVLPSHEGEEGLPRALFETMGCGTTVIGSRIAGITEAITDESGILVPEKSPEALAAAIINLVRSPETFAKLGNAGLHRAKHYFGERRHAADVETFYTELLAGKLA